MHDKRHSIEEAVEIGLEMTCDETERLGVILMLTFSAKVIGE